MSQVVKEEFCCLRCGNCCSWHGYVIISDEEVDQIASFLKLETKEFLAKFAKLTSSRKSLTLIEKENGECIFYNSTRKLCEIYEVRPSQCRRFPVEWNFQGWERECKWAQNHLKKEKNICN